MRASKERFPMSIWKFMYGCLVGHGGLDADDDVGEFKKGGKELRTPSRPDDSDDELPMHHIPFPRW